MEAPHPHVCRLTLAMADLHEFELRCPDETRLPGRIISAVPDPLPLPEHLGRDKKPVDVHAVRGCSALGVETRSHLLVGVEMKEQKIVDHRPKLKNPELTSLGLAPAALGGNTPTPPELAAQQNCGNVSAGLEGNI